MITQDELRNILNYNSETGIFRWKTSPTGNIKRNSIAGTIRNNGYRRIQINGKLYYAHVLAWLYEYGYLPENIIDHKDRNGDHNWIDNLREVSNQCNMRNTGNFSNNKSGVKGIYWSKRDKKYYSQIMLSNKTYYLGYFDDFDEAVCHRLAAEQCLNWSGCDSNSPAYQYVKENIQGVNK